MKNLNISFILMTAAMVVTAIILFRILRRILEPIARFSLAVDRRFRRNGDEQIADFISCIAFGKTAEFFERFGRKGTKFVLEGRIQTGSYTNKDGQRIYTTDVVVENAEFAESKNAASGNNNSNGGSAVPSPSGTAGDGFMSFPEGDEELPFH